MKQYTAIIVDDELAARNILENLLSKNCLQIKILDKVASVQEAVISIKKHQPQIVFLDVEMPNFAGYEIVRFIKDIDFQILFVTAYNQYAIKAFELNAIDYLLKPIHRQRLQEAVDRAIQQIELENTANELSGLLQTIKEKDRKTIVLTEANNKKLIYLKDIIAIEAKGAYSAVYIRNAEKMLVSKNIGYFDKLLHGLGMFFRSHKSWIIQVDAVERYQLTNSAIVMEQGVEARISRQRKSDFVKLFKGLNK